MFNSLLLSSDSLKISSNEEIDQLRPFLVGLDGASQNLDFSGEHPEDGSDRFGDSVVAGDDDIDEIEGSVGVAESNSGDVDVAGFDDGLVVALGVSDDQESGFLELLGDLIGECSGNPSGGGGGGAAGVLTELVDGTLSVFFGADDDDFSEVGDGGDDSGGEFDASVDFIDFEDVVA